MSAHGGADAAAAPVLSAAELVEVAEFGAERQVAAGDVLFAAGESSYDLFVVLEGEVEIVAVLGPDDNGAEHDPIFVFGPGNFVGELNLLTGQRRFLTARVSKAGRMLVIPQPDFRRLMSLRPALAGVIFGALLARRELLRTGEGAQAIRIIGSRYSPQAMSLRSFAEHSRLAHTWIDVEDAEDIEVLLRHDGPVPAGHARGDHADGDPAPRLARGLRRTPRADLPAETGLHLRPRRRRQRSRRPGRVGVWRLGGPAHRLAGRDGDRRAGRFELANRELHRLPQRHLRRRSHRQIRGPGDAARGTAELPLRGRGPAGRGGISRGDPAGRLRDPDARRDRRLRRQLPAPGCRRSGALRGRRRLLRGDRPRGACLQRQAGARDRRRQLRGTGRDPSRRAQLQRHDRDPPRRPHPEHVPVSDRADRGRSEDQPPHRRRS